MPALTPKDWEWFDRNRGREGEDYHAMEFAALLDRARAYVAELETSQRQLLDTIVEHAEHGTIGTEIRRAMNHAWTTMGDPLL